MNFKHFILITTLFLISCSNMSLAPEVVRKSDVQKQQYVVIGTILDVTSVTIEGDRETGAAAGAAWDFQCCGCHNMLRNLFSLRVWSRHAQRQDGGGGLCRCCK